MIKNNKFKIAVASVVTLLPLLFGIIMWDKLPDTFAVHWGPSGEADGFASKAIGVFLLPILLEALFWLCLIVTAKDNKNTGQNRKAETLVIWIVPVISLVVGVIIYGTAWGVNIGVPAVMCWFFGIMALVFGNYMPKIKHNHTIGIKIKWTLNSEENWNATHRFAGKVWFICGLLILFCAFLPPVILAIVFFVLVAVIVVLPMIYSYNYNKKEKRSGE